MPSLHADLRGIVRAVATESRADQNENSEPTIDVRRPYVYFLPSPNTPIRSPREIHHMTFARLFLALLLMPAVAVADESQVVPLWPGGIPGLEGKNEKEKVVELSKNQKHDRRVSSIHEPSLTVYLPAKDKATGAAVVICPGGGHRVLAIDHEGYEVAHWLASQGVAGFVLKYRLANEEGFELQGRCSRLGRRPAGRSAWCGHAQRNGESTPAAWD